MEKMGARVVKPGELLEVLFEDVDHHESGSSSFTGRGRWMLRCEDNPSAAFPSVRAGPCACASATVVPGPPPPRGRPTHGPGPRGGPPTPARGEGGARARLEPNPAG